MKQSLLLIACFLLLLPLAEAPCQQRVSVAVMDLKVTNVSKDEVDLLVDFLNNALFETGFFDVVQRGRRDQLIKEIEFSYSDVADAARTKTLGKLLASRFLVFGSIGRIGSKVLFNLTTVEVETGRTVSTHSKSYGSLEEIIDGFSESAQTISENAGRYIAERGEKLSTDAEFYSRAKMLYHEDFEKKTWLQTDKLSYNNGRYQIFSADSDWYTWQQHIYGDFVFEVEAQWVGGAANFGFGLIYRVQDADNYYLFDITNTGFFKVDKRIGGEYHALTEWERSSAINPTGVNFLKVIAIGNRFTFFINNNRVKELTDDSFEWGKFGLFSGQGVRAAFDNLKIYQGRLFLYENFERVTDDWHRDDMAFIRDGEYVLLPEKDGYFSWRGETLSDFSYKADVKWLGGAIDRGFGLTFNFRDTNNNYSFIISKNGYYMLGRYVAGQWADLISWRKSPLVNEEGKNALKVQVRGEKISLFVNDNLVDEYEDSEPIEGQIGFVSYTDVKSSFDEIEIFLLE
jgi:hypothetical protein